MTFQAPVDIANRACQHCGVPRIASLLDPSDAAREINFTYDKVRRAELRRNVWRFATRRAVLRALDTNSYMLQPATWSATKTYMAGSVVMFGTQIYISRTNLNLNNEPDLSVPQWALYFGPLVASLWQAPGLNGTATLAASATVPPSGGYFAGELVYSPQGENYVPYLSLVSGNTDTPGTYPQWSPTTNYNIGDTVILSTTSLVYDPGSIPVFSDPGAKALMYFAGPYQSKKDVNVGIVPTYDTTGSWVAAPIAGMPDVRFGQKWLQLDATIGAIVVPYPLGAGPLSETRTHNAFMLPNGFLRAAPQEPKLSRSLYVGFPSALPQNDWTWEGNFIVSSSSRPLFLRFVADTQDVTAMDDMFCEGLAARIAKETCFTLVQDKADRVARYALVNRAYREIMGEARTVNGIEIGPITSPLDDWISTRL